MLFGGLGSVDDAARERLTRLLCDVRYELLPLSDVRRLVRHLPSGCDVSVTADPVQGIGATVELTVDLARQGFSVVPHLAAQLFRDRSHLEEVVSVLDDAGVHRALVIGGVADEPGEFFDASALLDGLDDIGSPLRVGIGGYPEGHHVLDDELVHAALVDKASRADWITTQICFDVPRLRTWLADLRTEGVDLPVWLGIPAVADLSGLVSLGLRAGAGRSLQFMFEHPRLVSRLLRPGGRAATRLVGRLGELATDVDGIAGFHLFTYNQLRAAERWRRRLVRDVSR